MIVNILPPGPPRMLEATLFAAPTQQMQSYISQRNQQLDYRVTNYYGAQGQAFIQQSNDFYQQYVTSSGIKQAEIIAEQTASALSYQSGHIVPLETIEELQKASGDHLDYLMANPEMTRLYLAGRIDGYSEKWSNNEGEAIGWDRDAYRVAVNGMGRSGYDPTFEGPDEEWNMCSNSMSDFEGGGLSFQGQTNLLRSWNIQNNALREAIDPSSIDGFEVRPET